MLPIDNLNVVNQVKVLKLNQVVDLVKGQDNLDQLCIQLYGDQSYWKYLAWYNDIFIPFELVSQGYQAINAFSKTDIDGLILILPTS
jgi:hypothetical protein